MISFIIPFYNRYELCKKAVTSVINADFRNIEILLIDDCSTDSGLESFLAWTKQFSGIVYDRLVKNSGPGIARNRGLELAKGDWVFFMDSDDAIYSPVLTQLANFANNDAINADIIVFNKVDYIYADETTNHICHNLDAASLELTKDFWLSRGCTVWRFLYSMRFIKENRLRFINLYNHEDAVFTIEAFLSAKNLVLFDVSAFYAHFDDNYTMESSNQLTFTGGESFIDCGLEAYLYIRNLLNKPAYPDERKNIIKDYLSAFILRLYIKTSYRQENLLDFEKTAIANFSSVVYNYSNAFKKEIYIVPCFQSALGAARFIMSIGGVLGGILDNNPNSIVAARTKKYASQWLAKDYQLNILRPQDIINFDKKLVLVFGFHSGAIAAQLASMGLTRERHYIETGLF